MLHFIGHVGVRDTEFFIRKHVFPGGWIPSLAETIVAMEDAGLEVVDVENLRRHYAPTLDAWAERFDRNWEKIHALDPQRFDRRFRRYGAPISAAPDVPLPAADPSLQIIFSKGNVRTRATR
jgi:cyclopropane-fatty-acyl-phospholipid synthase